MSFHDARLEQLQREIARKRQLEAQREELRAQQQQLAEKVQTLEACSQKEQADVDRLEGRSLSAYFYHVVVFVDEPEPEVQKVVVNEIMYILALRFLKKRLVFGNYSIIVFEFA